MTEEEKIKKLFSRFLKNECDEDEIRLLLLYFKLEDKKELLMKLIREEAEHDEGAALSSEFSNLILNQTYEKINRHVTSRASMPLISRKIWLGWTAAVIAFVLSSGVVYYFLYGNSGSQVVKTPEPQLPAFDVSPAANNAVLTLENGETIILDSAANGPLIQQGNMQVTKVDGQIIYMKSGEQGAVSYNTITTPPGRQYQIILSDGSKVWLNAASALQFPAPFSGKERRVQLRGEGYFEVTESAEIPFKVETNKLEVKVLGTRFNVHSYEDETILRTTLLEGRVSINCRSESIVLLPGQQANLDIDGNLEILQNVEVDEIVAWKEGKFQFQKANIEEVMREVARWYNVEIEYEGPVNSHFGGSISRDADLRQVLQMLQLTGEVKFRVEGKTVVVLPIDS